MPFTPYFPTYFCVKISSFIYFEIFSEQIRPFFNRALLLKQIGSLNDTDSVAINNLFHDISLPHTYNIQAISSKLEPGRLPIVGPTPSKILYDQTAQVIYRITFFINTHFCSLLLRHENTLAYFNKIKNFNLSNFNLSKKLHSSLAEQDQLKWFFIFVFPFWKLSQFLPFQQLLILKMSRSKSNTRVRINFSNVFSPQSQLLLKSRRNNTVKLLNEPKFPTKSPKRALMDIPNIATYRQISKIVLNGGNADSMFERLQVQAQAQQMYEERIKRKDYYLQYDYNPLTYHLKSQHHESSIDATGSKNGNLIHSFVQLQSRSNNQQMQGRLRQISNTLHNNIQSLSRKSKATNHYSRPQKQQTKNPTSNSLLNQKEPLQGQFQFLDNLIRTKQEKYTPYRQDQQNIFSLLFETDNRSFQPIELQLQRTRFCRDSILTFYGQKQKNRYKVNPFLQISTFNREIIKNIFTKELPQRFVLGQGDININLEKITFKDIILVATNKLQSKSLSDYLYAANPSTSNNGNNQNDTNILIDLPLYTRDKAVNVSLLDPNQIDVIYYGKASLTRTDLIQREISNQQKEQLKKCLRIEEKAIINTVRDKTFLKKLQQRKNAILLKQIDSNSNPRINRLSSELERKVRMSKTNKSKAQKIKIDLLCQSLRMKNRMQMTLKNISHKMGQKSRIR